MKKILVIAILIFRIVLIDAQEVNAQKISAGSLHSLFLCSNSIPMACGSNSYGELGDSTTSLRKIPIQVHNLSGINSIASGT